MTDFEATFIGAHGEYVARFVPGVDEGEIEVNIADHQMRWAVETKCETSSGFELAGLTHGSKPLWGDVFWFVLRNADRPTIQYWRDEILVRSDAAV